MEDRPNDFPALVLCSGLPTQQNEAAHTCVSKVIGSNTAPSDVFRSHLALVVNHESRPLPPSYVLYREAARRGQQL